MAGWENVAAAAIQGGASAAQGLFGYFSNKQDRQLRLQMYEDAKNYNSPAAQVSRMQLAGLNPYAGNISADQISDSVDLGQNPMQSIGSAVEGLGRAAQNYVTNHISRENADTAMINAESNRINAEANKSNAEVNRLLSEARKLLLQSQTQQNIDSHELFDKTKDFRISEANLKYQITKFLRNRYSREDSWMTEHYDELQDAMLQGIISKNAQIDYMMNNYYPSVLELNNARGDLDYNKYKLQEELAHPFGVTSSEASVMEKFLSGLIRAILSSK